MSKRKLPGGLAVAEAAKITCTDSDADATAPKYPTVQGPVDFSPMNGVQIDFTIAASAVAVSNEAVQVIESQHAPEHPALQLDKVQGSPPKMVPKGSPAESFMQASPTKVTEDVSALTCNLSLIPKDRWNKRRSLSAIVLAALPIQSKSSTVRRNVVLRDELDECTVTVWGNHTNILNEAAIGRPVTLQRVCLTAFEGKIQIAMPKDSSVALGNTPQTIPILHWMQRVGTTAVTVTQVRQRQYSNMRKCIDNSTGHCNAAVDCCVHPRHLGKGCARNSTDERQHPAPFDHDFDCGRSAQSFSHNSILERKLRNGGVVRTTDAPSRERNQNTSCSRSGTRK